MPALDCHETQKLYLQKSEREESEYRGPSYNCTNGILGEVGQKSVETKLQGQASGHLGLQKMISTEKPVENREELTNKESEHKGHSNCCFSSTLGGGHQFPINMK